MSDELTAYAAETATCTRCVLAKTRTQVVFGSGSPTADLVFVGEAPGFHEDKNGVPFVGAAGKLLEKLLTGISLQREDVYIANVLKCLSYNALVQLGDGSWERIGRLVRSHYSGTVMSVDADGQLVPRRVTGWHATPVGDRRVFRLSYRSAKRAGSSKVGIQLTGDHPVLTTRGFVPVQELEPGDEIAIGQGLSNLARDVVCGSLLGDASINAASSYVSFGHSIRQHEYAAFKAELLAELSPTLTMHTVAGVVGGTPSYDVVHVRTRAHRGIRRLRREFYGDKKHVPTWLEADLNDRMLAFWFMDDGYTRLRPPRSPLAEIATNGFDESGIQTLLRALKRLGLPAKSLRGRIFFDVMTTQRLLERIAPYVPESMRYKLGPAIADRIPFDKSLFSPSAPAVMYDEVEVEDITDQQRDDTTFFCIDVEETHNFATAGGVVHNCRPPGNRDPLQEEIEACEGHLFRQIELIQPKVVATLGNFSTKLLSGKPDGITKVHGVPQQVTLGGSTVTLYPLFHPAAALYTPRMLDVLTEDFARLPQLMAGEVVSAPAPVVSRPAPPPEVTTPSVAAPVAGEPSQLGLF